MKKAWKILLSVIIAGVILTTAAERYYSETTAILWHLRHGSRAELGGYRFKVPYLYYADDPHGLGSLSITKLPGDVQHGMAFITIDLGKQASPEELRSALYDETMQRAHLRKIAERNASLAGREGVCVEYDHDFADPNQERPARLMSGTTIIHCSFDRYLGARFLGSKELKQDFYEIMRTAERAKDKT